MSLAINISAVSTNGRTQTVLSYYNGKNADMVNVIPNEDELTEYYSTFKNIKGYKLSINISSSTSQAVFSKETSIVSNYGTAKGILLSNLNMLRILKND